MAGDASVNVYFRSLSQMSQGGTGFVAGVCGVRRGSGQSMFQDGESIRLMDGVMENMNIDLGVRTTL